MTNKLDILVDRIDARLQALDLSDRKASMRAVGKPDLIRDIRRGKVPLSDRLRDLAAALETTVDYLQGAIDNPNRESPQGGPVLPEAEALDRDIPVYGTALGAEAAFWTEHAGDIAIEQTDLNTGEVVDYFRRPPALRHRRDIYVLYPAGVSMEPAFEEGRAFIVDPKRPPSIRDYVVVYLRDRSDEFASAVLIKRLVKRSGTYVELEQFNPPAVFRLEMRQIREMHRVMPWDEAFGI